MTPEQLRSARKAARITQAELAERVGKSRVAIGLMERGASPISKTTALAVAYVLRIPEHALNV